MIRRTSPQQSPSSSPPTTRHGSSDQLSRPAAEFHGMYRVSLSFNPKCLKRQLEPVMHVLSFRSKCHHREGGKCHTKQTYKVRSPKKRKKNTPQLLTVAYMSATLIYFIQFIFTFVLVRAHGLNVCFSALRFACESAAASPSR